MLLVPDITAGTGTEFEETLVRGGSVGRSQSEGAQERVLSVDGSLSEWDCGVRREVRSKSSSEPPGHFPIRRFHGQWRSFRAGPPLVPRPLGAAHWSKSDSIPQSPARRAHSPQSPTDRKSVV